MGFKIHRRLLNKEFIPILYELNKDVLENFQDFGNNEFRCCLKPVSSMMPSFFFRVRLNYDDDTISVSNVTDTQMKGIQLNVEHTLFKGTPADDGKIVFEGDIGLANSLPDLIEQALKRMKQKIVTRIKIFIDSM